MLGDDDARGDADKEQAVGESQEIWVFSEAPRALEVRQISAQRVEGAKKIAKAALLASAASVPFTLGVYFGLDSTLGLQFLGLELVVAVYAAGLLALLRRGHFPPWLDWLCTAFETSIPAGIILLDAARVGPAYALTSAPVMLFPVAIFFSSLRLRPRLSLFAGALAATEFAALYLWLRAGMGPEQLAALPPAISAANIAQRATYLLLAGLGAYWLGRSLRTLIEDLVATLRREFRARSMLGRQVTPQVAKLLLGPEAKPSAGEKRAISVLFCDLRNFTTFSERRDPAEVLGLLNDLLAAACESVDRNGGIVNKFLGDGLMAIFGAPIADAGHARRAAEAALDIAALVEPFRERWNLPEFDLGVGIHSGEALVGIVGSEERSEYTAIGDTVNLASRVEGLNRQFGTRILVSDETRAQLGQMGARRMGEAHVKGREQPVVVWSLQLRAGTRAA